MELDDEKVVSNDWEIVDSYGEHSTIAAKDILVEGDTLTLYGNNRNVIGVYRNFSSVVKIA